MADLREGLLKGIVEAFAHIVQARNKQRGSIFDDVVKGRFETLRHIHRSFHTSLGPVRITLAELEEEIRHRGDDVEKKLSTFYTLVHDLEASRYLGRPERRELYERCQFLARSGFRFSGLTEPLDETERHLVTLFMNDVCAYFANNDKYEHEYGNTIGGLAGFADFWLNIRAPSVDDLIDVRARLDGVISRMEERWAMVIQDFSRIEASLRNNVRTGSDDLGPPSTGIASRLSRREPSSSLPPPLEGSICAA